MEKSTISFVDERNFEQEVLLSELPVLVDFQAEWCGPCKTMAPELEGLADELAGKLKIVKVDIDRSKMLAQQLRIQTVPTTMLFVQGRLAGGKTGALKRAQLRQMVEPFLPRAQGAIKPIEAAELRKRGAIVFIDTREAPVFGRAHLPGAVNMPLEEIENRLAELHMLPGAPVLYCRSGDKSQALAEKLAESGLEVAFLEGGILGWESEGFGIERPD